MKLIFIHGAPASGKLTVAKALLRIIEGRLFDNHAAIDIARTVFDFGAPGFWELVHSVRLSVLNAASEQCVPVLVMTFCYSDPEDRTIFKEFESIIQQHKGLLLPVFLSCSETELLRRVSNADRIEHGKIKSESGLRRFLAESNMTKVPSIGGLNLSSETKTAEEIAWDIVRHFRLEAKEDS